MEPATYLYTAAKHNTVQHITSVRLDTRMILGPTAKLPLNLKHVYIIFTLTNCPANITHNEKTVNTFWTKMSVLAITFKCGGIHITAQLLPLLRSPLHISAALSRSLHLCLASKAALFRAPARETKSAGHAYQLCQPTNAGPDKPAEIRIKGGQTEQQTVQSERSKLLDPSRRIRRSNTSKKKKQRRTARPQCLMDRGTTIVQLSSQQQLLARHSRLPSTSPPAGLHTAQCTAHSDHRQQQTTRSKTRPMHRTHDY
jgi:hypothetical protein